MNGPASTRFLSCRADVGGLSGRFGPNAVCPIGWCRCPSLGWPSGIN